MRRGAPPAPGGAWPPRRQAVTRGRPPAAASSRPLTDAQREAVAANLGLVHSVVNRLGRRVSEDARHDLVQEGALGLMWATRKYDQVRGAFSTYAVYWIRRYVLNELRRQRLGDVHVPNTIRRLRRPGDLLSGGTPIDTEDRDGVSLSERLPSEDSGPEEALEVADAVRRVEDGLSKLKPRDAEFMRTRFGLGTADEVTATEAGGRIGLNRHAAADLQRRALASMRKLMTPWERSGGTWAVNFGSWA